MALSSQRRRPFRYRTLGVFVDMGRHQAVASTLGIKWRGFPAWFLARTYHLGLMPGLARRARLVTDWTTGCCSGATRPSSASSATRRRWRRRAGAGPAASEARRRGTSSAVPAFASTTERARRHSFIRFGGTARSTRTGRPSLPEPDQVEREAHRERVHRAAAREVQRVGGRHRVELGEPAHALGPRLGARDPQPAAAARAPRSASSRGRRRSADAELTAAAAASASAAACPAAAWGWPAA